MFDISMEPARTGLGQLSALLEGWMPPSRENWQMVLTYWQFGFPIFASFGWIIKWYGMGKTSVSSPLNLPGRLGWMLMECPGFMTLLYIMRTLPAQAGIEDLPWQNKVLAGLFVIHYIYRAIIFPLIAPSMSPIHLFVAFMAATFQVLNGSLIGSWLAAYGPVTETAWKENVPIVQFVGGIAIFYVGLAANFFHDEELREIRRRESRRQEKIKQQNGAANGSVDKHYRIPEAGLFRYVLYPHYLCEWVEWFGFYVAAGWGCMPALAFVVNEISTMLPRAVKGKAWYMEKFGEEKIRRKYAVIPGVI